MIGRAPPGLLLILTVLGGCVGPVPHDLGAERPVELHPANLEEPGAPGRARWSGTNFSWSPPAVTGNLSFMVQTVHPTDSRCTMRVTFVVDDYRPGFLAGRYDKINGHPGGGAVTYYDGSIWVLSEEGRQIIYDGSLQATAIGPTWGSFGATRNPLSGNWTNYVAASFLSAGEPGPAPGGIVFYIECDQRFELAELRGSREVRRFFHGSLDRGTGAGVNTPFVGTTQTQGSQAIDVEADPAEFFSFFGTNNRGHLSIQAPSGATEERDLEKPGFFSLGDAPGRWQLEAELQRSGLAGGYYGAITGLPLLDDLHDLES